MAGGRGGLATRPLLCVIVRHVGVSPSLGCVRLGLWLLLHTSCGGRKNLGRLRGCCVYLPSPPVVTNVTLASTSKASKRHFSSTSPPLHPLSLSHLFSRLLSKRTNSVLFCYRAKSIYSFVHSLHKSLLFFYDLFEFLAFTCSYQTAPALLR